MVTTASLVIYESLAGISNQFVTSVSRELSEFPSCSFGLPKGVPRMAMQITTSLLANERALCLPRDLPGTFHSRRSNRKIYNGQRRTWKSAVRCSGHWGCCLVRVKSEFICDRLLISPLHWLRFCDAASQVPVF